MEDTIPVQLDRIAFGPNSMLSRFSVPPPEAAACFRTGVRIACLASLAAAATACTTVELVTSTGIQRWTSIGTVLHVTVPAGMPALVSTQGIGLVRSAVGTTLGWVDERVAAVPLQSNCLVQLPINADRANDIAASIRCFTTAGDFNVSDVDDDGYFVPGRVRDF